MNKTQASITTALTGLFALTAASISLPAQAEAAKMEKCYGIVKAGKNDCQTNSSACVKRSASLSCSFGLFGLSSLSRLFGLSCLFG